MNKITSRHYAFGLAGSLTLLLLIMSLSRPSVEKPFLLFSFFCVFFVFCFSLSSVVGLLLFGSRSRLSAAILIAAVMTVLLVLRTFLELRWVEVLLILAVSALGYWYFTIQR